MIKEYVDLVDHVVVPIDHNHKDVLVEPKVRPILVLGHDIIVLVHRNIALVDLGDVVCGLIRRSGRPYCRSC